MQNARHYPDATNWKFDAAGRMTYWLETATYVGTTKWDQGETLTFDGDGRTAKRLKRQRIFGSPPTGWSEVPEYYIYSSVTGQKLIELDDTGAMKKINVHMGSTVIAEYTSGFGPVFKHTDPITGSQMQTEASGEITPYDVGRVELEALGAVIQTQEPETQEPPHNYGKGGSTSNPEHGCAAQGSNRLGPMPCRLSETFINYLTSVFGLETVGQHLRTEIGLGSGGVGADNEPFDRLAVRGLRLVRDRNGFAIKGVDFRYSWVFDAEQIALPQSAGVEDVGTPRKGKKGLGSPKIDDQKLRDCIFEYFNVATRSYEIGKTFTGLRAISPFEWLLQTISGVEFGEISLTTEGRNSGELAFMRYGIYGGGAGIIYGYTYPANQWRTVGVDESKVNYVTNEVGTREFQESIWVYELGNWLGYRTGNKPTVADPTRYDNVSEENPDDIGGALVDCVYGGRVTATGQITPPAPGR